MENVPACLHDKVMLPNRPMHDGKNHQKRRVVEAYIGSQHFQVNFEQMNVGSVAVWLSLEDDNDISRYAFKIQKKRGDYSPWLHMGVVSKRDPVSKEITWTYVQPKPSSFTNKKERYLAKKVAGLAKSWMLGGSSTSEWNEDEMLLSWDRDDKDKGWFIGAEQYDQLATVLLAIDKQSASPSQNDRNDCAEDE